MRKVINRVLKPIYKRKLISALPGIEENLAQYAKGSDTTGTQWITLWFAVDGILRHKPNHILESGTGASTIVLAEAVRAAQKTDPSYSPMITSMESVEKWYEIASANLPPEYSDIVEIRHGPREKFEWALFRGYIHGNIPDRPYDFFFLDGPNYDDTFGTSFCADVLFAAQNTSHSTLRGVIDGRTSSAFVLQTLLGTGVARYFIPNMACRFEFETKNLRTTFTSTDFKAGLFGRLTLGREFTK